MKDKMKKIEQLSKEVDALLNQRLDGFPVAFQNVPHYEYCHNCGLQLKHSEVMWNEADWLPFCGLDCFSEYEANHDAN